MGSLDALFPDENTLDRISSICAIRSYELEHVVSHFAIRSHAVSKNLAFSRIFVNEPGERPE